MVQNALRTDSLWAIVQFYAFARTQVFHKSNFWSPWSIFLSTKVWIFYMVCGHLFFLTFWLALSLLGNVGCRLLISATVEFSTHISFIALWWCAQRWEQTFFFQFNPLHWETQNLKIIVMIQILQLLPLICPESDASLIWITFSSPSSGCLGVCKLLFHLAIQMLSLITEAKSLGQSNPLW